MPTTIQTWQTYSLINGRSRRVRKHPTKVNENLRIFGVALTKPGLYLIFTTRTRPKAYKGIHISGDEARLTTVIKNLIDNALKYSAADADSVRISAFKEASSVIIQVEDAGPGIPEEKLPFIFEPFYKVDNTRAKQLGGYGLGLHLCKRIMEVHGAELKISNRIGTKGLTAKMVFPLSRKSS